MKPRSVVAAALALAVALFSGLVAPQRARAQDFDLGLEVTFDLHAHNRVIWTEFYGCGTPSIDACVGLGWSDDDVGVALFLSNHARCDVQAVIGLRRTGLSWLDVTLRLDLAPAIFFVAIPDDVEVGPPYGRAYGYHRKRDPGYVLVDVDIHNLVGLHLTSRYYGLDPLVVIRHRASGKSFGDLVKEHHGKSKGVDAAGRPVKQERPAKGAAAGGEKGGGRESAGGDKGDRGGKPDKGGPPSGGGGPSGGRGKGKGK